MTTHHSNYRIDYWLQNKDRTFGLSDFKKKKGIFDGLTPPYRNIRHLTARHDIHRVTNT